MKSKRQQFIEESDNYITTLRLPLEIGKQYPDAIALLARKDGNKIHLFYETLGDKLGQSTQPKAGELYRLY